MEEMRGMDAEGRDGRDVVPHHQKLAGQTVVRTPLRPRLLLQTVLLLHDNDVPVADTMTVVRRRKSLYSISGGPHAAT